MNSYDDFRAKAITSIDELKAKLSESEGPLTLYKTFSLGRESFVEKFILIGGLSCIIMHELSCGATPFMRVLIVGDDYQGGDNYYETSVGDAGAMPHPHNRHLLFLDQKNAQDYCEFSKTDPALVLEREDHLTRWQSTWDYDDLQDMDPPEDHYEEYYADLD
jgi:hypothetical protein